MKKGILIALFLLIGGAARCQQFIFVFLNKKQDAIELAKEQLDKLMEGHMANIGRLAKEGKLLAAGPFDGGGGIFVFKSNSKKEVEEWLSTDPGVQAKRWNIEIFNYHPRIGSVCLVKEPYEMTNYNFVRFEVNLTKYTLTQLSDQIKEHDGYLKKLAVSGNVISEGTFDANEGGILVMRGEMKKDVIELDPAVQKEFMEFAIKKLYIAKGAFCEK